MRTAHTFIFIKKYTESTCTSFWHMTQKKLYAFFWIRVKFLVKNSELGWKTWLR